MTPAGPRWAPVVGVLVLVDQLSKLAAVRGLEFQQPHPVVPGFNLTLMHNPGAAFSFLADAGGWQRWFFVALATGVSVLLVMMIRQTERSARLHRAGLVLVLGGAIGNLIDRLRLGYVIDFVELYYRHWSWPAFNVADSAITVGAGFLLWSALREPGGATAGKP